MRSHLKNNYLSGVIITFCFVMLPNAFAGRPFTLSYKATTEEKGELEYEQWVTWKTDKDNDSDFSRFDVRHELEYGISDQLQLGLYFDWRYQSGSSVKEDRIEFRDVALETIYNLTNPKTGSLGSALYAEVKAGDEVFELEGKLIIQKNVGNMIYVWNVTVAAEWEGSEYDEDKGEFSQTFGLSYKASEQTRFGFELLHELEYEDWSEWNNHVVYLGPTLSYDRHDWWVTITPTIEATDVDGEANFLIRAIFGVEF